MTYALSASLNKPINEAIETLKEICMKHKLGINSEIDAQATIKNKIGADIMPYKILGACNPTLAKDIIEAEPKAGALLPCTIAVYEKNNKTFFEFMNPIVVLTLDENEIVRKVAKQAKEHIDAVINDLNNL